MSAFTPDAVMNQLSDRGFDPLLPHSSTDDEDADPHATVVLLDARQLSNGYLLREIRSRGLDLQSLPARAQEVTSAMTGMSHTHFT